MTKVSDFQNVSNRSDDGGRHNVNIPPTRLSEQPNKSQPDGAPPGDSQQTQSHLEKILQTQRELKAAKARTIIFSPPILTQNGNAFIYPYTINVIQGQNGVHKSRLAETVCSTLLKLPNCEDDLVGFEANTEQTYTACHVDTERNLKEQLPYALQSIQLKAGYDIADHPANFDYISLLDIPRHERFAVLQEYLTHIRKTFSNHIFIVLDVITDCVRDWNRPDDSMEIIDLMNQTINHFDVTFLCLIHENPGQQKARGHLGTEIMNKASTAIQIGYEKDAAGNDTDLIRVKYLKCRNTKRLEPFYLKYDDQIKGLVLADASEVSALSERRKEKALPADVAEKVEQYLADEPMKNAELLEVLTKDFDTSERTITERLKEIIKNENNFHNGRGEPCKLSRKKDGKEVIFYLEPLLPF